MSHFYRGSRHLQRTVARDHAASGKGSSSEKSLVNCAVASKGEDVSSAAGDQREPHAHGTEIFDAPTAVLAIRVIKN
jgi:hypothetical protein